MELCALRCWRSRLGNSAVCARAHRKEVIELLLGSMDFLMRADVPSGLINGHRLRNEVGGGRHAFQATRVTGDRWCQSGWIPILQALVAPPMILKRLCVVDKENGDIHPMATAHGMPVLRRVAAVLINLLETRGRVRRGGGSHS